MILTLCGPAGSGKTTLAKKLSEELGGEFITNISRNIMEEMGITLEDTVRDREVAFDFQKRIFERFVKLLGKCKQNPDKLYIFDRSLLDAYVYSFLTLGVEVTTKHFSSYLKHLELYDLIIYCEPPNHFIDDGVRSKTYLNLGERFLFEVMVKPHANVTLRWIPLEERVKRVRELLEEYRR